MYDIMIIDDDKSIIDHLESMIEWNRLDLRLVCTARDSDTALELYSIHRPKIVITDINIPTISGLELAHKLTEIDPEIRFIVITGYSDFENVKQSVALGAIDLLSKPLLPDEVNLSLEKAILYFEELRSKQASDTALQQLLKENAPLLREKYVSYLLKPHLTQMDFNIEERLITLDLDLIGTYYAAILITPELYHKSPNETDLMLFATKNISDEILSTAGFKVFSFIDDEYRLNYLASWNFENGNELIEETINVIYEKINFFFHMRIYAGIGKTVKALSALSVSWNQALTALSYQGVLGPDTIINYTNIESLDAPVISDTEQIIERLSKHFKTNNLVEITDLLNKYFNYLTANTTDSDRHIREFAFKYVSAILAASFSLGINVKSVSGYTDIFVQIFSCKNMITLKQYVMEMTQNLLNTIFQKRSDSKNQLIDMAKTFIHENLENKNLSLDMVSKHICLSSIYFCKLFHKEEGISFNEYLNMTRIECAKKLLDETNKKVFEISYEIGYGNPKHFNYMFKRLVGITPLEYKRSLVQ